MRSTRGGATAIAAGAVTVMTVGAAALLVDHMWLVGQRDTLKSATDAASIAATITMNRLVEADHTLSDDDLRPRLEAVARRYIVLNLTALPPDRFARAKATLAIALTIDRAASRVEVGAEADLGGTLMARAMPLLGGYAGPATMRANTTTECEGTAVEVVLALDVTASMHGSIDPDLPARGGNRRLNVAVSAAKGLVEDLRSACEESAVAIGVVPWDKTVRVPGADTWRRNRWAEVGHGRRSPPPSDWAGCVEDREHGANPLNARALALSSSLSLELPSSSPFPAFAYPDTRQFPVAPMAASIRAAFPDLSGTQADLDLEAGLRALRDNDWGRQGRRGVGGRNSHCTATAMLPLTTDLDAVDAALDRVRTGEVWGGGTLAHLGVTWGRRMLAPSWRAVWGDDDHPVDRAEREVTKVLVLLTDGGNVLADKHSLLPGRLDAKHVGVPDCLDTETRRHACRQGDWGSFYSAVGRLGPGDRNQGHYYSDWSVDKSWGGGQSAEATLSALMKHSCALAREEGVTVYTIGAMPDTKPRWRDALVECSGAPGTSESSRSTFYFSGHDRASLEHAFRAIARRVISVRRVT